MTDQGKPDRCPTCSSASMEYRTFPYCHNSWHSSPVPAAAPNYLNPTAQETIGWIATQEKRGEPQTGFPKPSAPQAESVPSVNHGFQEQMIEALGLDTGRIWFGAGVIAAAKAKANLVAELERSNSLLRERITAAEGLLRDFRDCYEFGDYVDSRIDDYFKEKP